MKISANKSDYKYKQRAYYVRSTVLGTVAVMNRTHLLFFWTFGLVGKKRYKFTESNMTVCNKIFNARNV